MVANISRTRRKPPVTKYDDDLAHRLVNFLVARQVPERESLHFDVHGGTVVVSGPLHSDHAKWLCIECCRHVAGVVKLVDEIVVELPPKRTGKIRVQSGTAGNRPISSSTCDFQNRRIGERPALVLTPD